MTTNYDYFIFDFDATISKISVDWDGVRLALHKRFPDIDFTSYSGGVTKVFELYGKEGLKEAHALCLEFESADIQGAKHIQPCIDFVKKCKGTKVIWSSNQTEVIIRVLSNIRILDEFEFIVGKDQVARAKPYIDGFALLQKKINFDLSKTLFIGDSSADREAAKNIGVDYMDVKDIM